MVQVNKTIKLFLSSPVRILIGLFAVAGLGIMVYLTYIHFSEVQSFCDISEVISCDIVTTGIYSEIFGLPVSILGLGYFSIILLLLFLNKKKDVFRHIFFITLFVLIPSLYLSTLELFVIKAFCILCETSKVLMVAVLITSYTAMQPKVTFRMVVPIIIAGLIATGITYFAQTGNVVQRDYSEFLTCLNDKGVVYYRSFRCSNCQRQEKLFGEAYPILNSVECHPEGPGGNPKLCLAKGVDKTPTFILEPEGIEIKRLEGLQPLKKLAEFTQCPLEQ